MTRFADETFSSAFLSRRVRVAVATKIAFVILAGNLSFAAAKAMFAQPPQPGVAAESGSRVAPFILPVAYPESEPAAEGDCQKVEVEADEGYGVRGRVIQYVCREAF